MSSNKTVAIFPYNTDIYLDNRAFDGSVKHIETSIFSVLRKFLNEEGFEIMTYDVVKKSPFRYVYFDLPYPWNFKVWKIILRNRDRNILICNESALVVPFNYWKILHTFFIKVYSWYDGFEYNKKYRRMLLPKTSDGINTKPKNFKNKKFLALINKNILPFFPFLLIKSFGKELYSERIKAIEYFEKTIPNDFYLYGKGWNKPKQYNLRERLLGFKKYSTYKGAVDDKLETLSNFKYSICFENLTGVNGYVTEKIFDCLKARCVPIYWGASDIEKYIPKNCFIDFRNFKNYEELLNHLNSIDEETYNDYIENIENLLKDKKFVATWFENQFARFFLEDMLAEDN